MSFDIDRGEFDEWIAEGPEGHDRIWAAYQEATKRTEESPVASSNADTIESLIVDSLEMAGNYQSFDWTRANEAIKEGRAIVIGIEAERDELRTRLATLGPDQWTEIVELVEVAKDSDHELRWCDGTQCEGCKRWGPLLEAVTLAATQEGSATGCTACDGEGRAWPTVAGRCVDDLKRWARIGGHTGIVCDECGEAIDCEAMTEDDALDKHVCGATL